VAAKVIAFLIILMLYLLDVANVILYAVLTAKFLLKSLKYDPDRLKLRSVEYSQHFMKVVHARMKATETVLNQDLYSIW